MYCLQFMVCVSGGDARLASRGRWDASGLHLKDVANTARDLKACFSWEKENEDMAEYGSNCFNTAKEMGLLLFQHSERYGPDIVSTQ